MTAAQPSRPHRPLAAVLAVLGVLVACKGGAARGTDAAAPPAAATPAATPAAAPEPAAVRLTYRVVATHPHDPQAFTQGLVWDGGGVLLESTGLYGRSSLREVELASGRVLRSVPLDPGLFGEGLARVGDRLLQLTWREGVALVWDRATLRESGRLDYAGEGWGLGWDGRDLWMSDGSATLVRRDPATLAERGRLPVTVGGRPLPNLNELECANGVIWANVWTSDLVVRIDPASGRVTGLLDLTGLLSDEERQGTDVLNGIAVDPASGHLLVTGKLWPKLFELAVGEPAAATPSRP